MNNQTRQTIGWLVTGVAVFAIAGSSLAKLAEAPEIVTALGKLGLSEKIRLIGLLEIILVSLYLIPRTMNIGFFLLCSYLGGAIVAHLAQSEISPQALIVLLLFWVGSFIRKPALFGIGQA